MPLRLNVGEAWLLTCPSSSAAESHRMRCVSLRLAEPVGDEFLDVLEARRSVVPLARHRHVHALRRRQNQHAHDGLGVGTLALALERHLALVAVGHLDQLRRRPGMQSKGVDDLECPFGHARHCQSLFSRVFYKKAPATQARAAARYSTT